MLRVSDRCSDLCFAQTNGRQGRRVEQKGQAGQCRAGRGRAGLGRAGQNRAEQSNRNAGPGERAVACPEQSCSRTMDVHNLEQGQQVVSYSPRHKAAEQLTCTISSKDNK